MKFFTFEWWRRAQSAGPFHDPIPAYEAHVKAIREELPAALLRLHGEISIHDARLRALDLDAAEQALALLLDGDDGKGGARRFALRFGGVTSFTSATHGDNSLPGPGGYGDLGYWELDVAPDGYELRMLYSTGIEMSVCFQEITIDTTDGHPTPDGNEY